MTKKLWLNMAKFTAILAVLIDHTNGVLYSKRSVAVASYFSVSLFIFVMGVTTFISYKNSKTNLWKKSANKICNISLSYIVATFVYQLMAFRQFDFNVFISYLVSFNISGPFYYILLYVQLVLISPVIFVFIESTFGRNNKLLKILYLCMGGR